MVGIAGLYLVNLVLELAAAFSDIILIFFLGWLVSFILAPVVALGHQLGLPRALAAAIAYLSLLFLVVLGLLLVVPALTAQVVQIATNLPWYAERAVELFQNVEAALAAREVRLDLSPLVNAQEITRRAEAIGPLILANALGIATSVITILFQATIVLIVAFYFTLDGEKISRAIVAALPERWQQDTAYFFASVNRTFAGFLRGQVILALIYAAGTGLTMTALGLEFVLLGTVLAGLFMLIPFLGPVLALIIPVSSALFTRPDALWLTLLVLIGLQQVLFNLVAPRIMSSTVGLHPLLVFFAFLAGARIAGFWGAFFGVPIVAVLATMISFYRATVEERRERLGQSLPDRSAPLGPESPGSREGAPDARATAGQPLAAAEGQSRETTRKEVLLP